MSCTSYGARSGHRTMLRLLGLRHSGTARFLLRRLAAGLGCSGRGALRTRTPSSSEVMPLSAALGFLSPTISWCRRALAFSSSSVDSPLAWAGGGDVIAARRAANARAAGGSISGAKASGGADSKEHMERMRVCGCRGIQCGASVQSETHTAEAIRSAAFPPAHQSRHAGQHCVLVRRVRTDCGGARGAPRWARGERRFVRGERNFALMIRSR